MIDTDYQYIDDGIQVSAVVLQPNGTTTWTCADAIRMNRSYEWANVGGGDFPGGLVTFGLWVYQCTERPKITGKITSGGVNYRIVRVDDAAALTRYDVICTVEL